MATYNLTVSVTLDVGKSVRGAVEDMFFIAPADPSQNVEVVGFTVESIERV